MIWWCGGGVIIIFSIIIIISFGDVITKNKKSCGSSEVLTHKQAIAEQKTLVTSNGDNQTYRFLVIMSGELKVTSRGLSKSWEVNKKHVCAYTGGKVSLTKNERYIVAQNSGDVSFLNLATGQITSSFKTVLTTV